MRRRARSFLVLVFLASTIAAAPAGAQIVPDEIEISASPTSSLVDGQTVQVDAPVTGPIFVAYQCPAADLNAALTGLGCDGLVVSPGSPITEVQVRRFVLSLVDREVHDCALEDCVLLIVGFSPAGLPPAVSPNDYGTVPLDFTATDIVQADATNGSTAVRATFLSVSPGSAAFAMRCAYLVAGGFVCGEVGTVDTAFDGNFRGTVTASREFLAGGVTVDCAVDACGVAVVVLGPGPTVSAGAGVRDPNF